MVVPTLLLLAGGPAWADARQDMLSGAQRCAGIANDRAFLDCYYGAAQPMRAYLGLPPAPPAQVRLVPPAMGAAAPAYAPAYVPPAPYQPSAGVPAYGVPAGGYSQPRVATAVPSGPPPLPHRRSKGFFGGLFGDSKPVVANTRMANYSISRSGKFTITLADGQVWQQLPGDLSEAHWKKPPSSYVVSVYEGAMGTYNLQVQGDAQAYKAERTN